MHMCRGRVWVDVMLRGRWVHRTVTLGRHPTPLGAGGGLEHPASLPGSGPAQEREGRRSGPGCPGCSRWTDLSVHDADLRVHDGPIRVFTIPIPAFTTKRDWCSRWTDLRVHDGAMPAACYAEDGFAGRLPTRCGWTKNENPGRESPGAMGTEMRPTKFLNCESDGKGLTPPAKTSRVLVCR